MYASPFWCARTDKYNREVSLSKGIRQKDTDYIFHTQDNTYLGMDSLCAQVTMFYPRDYIERKKQPWQMVVHPHQISDRHFRSRWDVM